MNLVGSGTEAEMRAADQAVYSGWVVDALGMTPRKFYKASAGNWFLQLPEEIIQNTDPVILSSGAIITVQELIDTDIVLQDLPSLP